jgi:predicted PurR-regulated permease PerM
MIEPKPNTSPHWSVTAKLVVALTIMVISAWLLLSFRSFWAPIIMVLILSYFFYPIISRIQKWLKIPWRLAVSLFFVFIVVILLGLLTWGGLSLFTPLQNLIALLQKAIKTLPEFINQFSTQVYQFGPFQFDIGNLDLPAISSQVLNTVEPLLRQIGTLVGQVASGAASLLGWVAFTLAVSYFILAGSEGIRGRMIHFEIPGYAEDFRILGRETGKIWGGFLRGQLVIVLITIVVYSILLSILGVRYAVGLAIMAGVARFVPYLGPWITWIVYALVSYFQGTTLFGVSPWLYVAIVLGFSVLTDTILDNLVATQIMAEYVQVHPAAVLVGALIAAQLLGIIGIVVAAPFLATIKLLLQYTMRKMFDLDPWEGMVNQRAKAPGFRETMRQLYAEIKKFWFSMQKAFKNLTKWIRQPTPRK